MVEDNYVCKIHKKIRKLNMHGDCFEEMDLMVQGITMKDVKVTFDERWK